MVEVSFPNSWKPLFEWHAKWHYKKQREFIEAFPNFWELVFVAGNGTGKTHILYWSLICLALGIHPHQQKLAFPPLVIKVLINDFEHGYGKIFKETCCTEQFMPDGTKISSILPQEEIVQWPSRDDRTLAFKNGSIFFFQTSEQRKKLHSGTNFDVLACDEEPDYPVYDESKRGLRTARGGGKILHAFTPPFDEEDESRGPSWTKFKLIDPYEEGTDKDVHVTNASMYENPGVTREYIRKFMKNKTEQQVRVQVFGLHPTWGKMIFPGFEDVLWEPKLKSGHLLPDDFELPFHDPDILWEMAIDWHASKPPAIIWTFEYLTGPSKGDVIVWDEMSPQMGKNKTILEICQAIKEIEGYRRIKIRRFGDPKMKDKNNALLTGFNAWQEFRHNGIYLTEGWNRQPGTGYSIMNDFLKGKAKDHQEHPRLFIKENCRTLRHNMKNHYWQRGQPDPQFSDYVSSLKYILQNKSRKIKKGMERGQRKYPIQSIQSKYGPYEHAYVSGQEMRRAIYGYRRTYG